MYKRLFSLIIALFVGINAVYAQEANWMPDPNLRHVVRKKLEISDDMPLMIYDLLQLYDLVSINDGIRSLEGLHHAVNLEFLHVAPNHISDLTPIRNLSNLRVLKLYKNEISDISPLAGLINLEQLALENNWIVDIAPLSDLVNLRELTLHYNQIADFSQLAGLVNLQVLTINGNVGVDISAIPTANLLGFEYDAVCDLPRPSIETRITDRNYPSVFAAWGGIVNLPTLSELEQLSYHDLYFGTPPMLHLRFTETGKGIHLAGDLSNAMQERETLKNKNPNLVLLAVINYYSGIPTQDYREYLPYLLKDEEGNPVIDELWGEALLDFTLPQTQNWVIQQAVAVSKCGLFDGILLDHWNEDLRLKDYRTLEEEHAARDAILIGIREAVSDDFLIMANTNHSKIPRWAPYVNGTFMETLPALFADYKSYGYTDTDLLEIESTLLWSEEHLREPRINGIEGWTLVDELPDAQRNLQWMRLFTTLSLTHSDGYVLFALGNRSDTGNLDYHDHYWYNFWDADLGQPIGEKAQFYKNKNGIFIEGLFIREFTNGWAVYNRSGTEQQIEFSEEVSGVESGVTSTEHTVPDLDGGIYLKANTEMTSPADVNKDRVVNILDLVLIAQHLGENVPSNSEVDVNGDGVVNILDLTFVAQHLGGGTAAAPATISETPDAAMIQAWIEQVQLENDGSIAFQYAIAKLQELLKSLIPEKTTLLPNYPNPFNPETWIPYHLANPSEVTISIYSVRGTLIRQLNLGHQHAGYYTDQSRAAYWDGRNEVGERVASGIYFYQLKTDKVSLLRKMLILK